MGGRLRWGRGFRRDRGQCERALCAAVRVVRARPGGRPLIGLVQELTKSAWLNVEAGRLRGRSFNIDRAVATLGRAEENVVGLFGDPGVQPATR